ncbi:hypothetical protein GMJAKD_05885 [Candidatus Electrothrix aarhusensis]
MDSQAFFCYFITIRCTASIGAELFLSISRYYDSTHIWRITHAFVGSLTRSLLSKYNIKYFKEMIGAADETFFGKVLILVFMDLSSGYLILEEIADDRSFDTWFEKLKPRLEELGATFR